MRYLLDTNICIHWLRGRYAVAEAVEEHGLENCCISEITMAELLFGEQLARQRGLSANREGLRRFFETIAVIPISEGIGLYAEEKARLRLSGERVEDFDLLIACTAASGGMTLVSENVRHMSRITGIQIENWVSRG